MFLSSHANALGASVALVVMFNAMVYVYIASQTFQVVIVVLLLYTISRVFRSLTWLISLNLIICASWCCVSWVVLPEPIWLILMTGVIGAAGVTTAESRVHHRRLRERESEFDRYSVQRQAEEAERKKMEERFHLALEGAKDGHWYWDLEAEKIYFSSTWASMIGFEEEELGNDPEEWFERVHPHNLPELKSFLSAHLYGKAENFCCQYRILHRDGSYVWVMSRGIALWDVDSNPTAIAGGQFDISETLTAEKKIVDDAYRDKLTGLPNREACMIRIQRCMEHQQEDQRNKFAVMFLDLDRFKSINDTFGHLVGDQLLAATASRIKNCLRDNYCDMVARFGGDEFVVLLEELRHREYALLVAERIRDALRGPFKLGKHDVTTGASIGVVYGDSRVEKTEDLLRNADTAMYQAKSQGCGQIQIFNEEMRRDVVRSFELSNDLATVLERGDLRLHYQPIVCLKTGKIVRAEALLRWWRAGELVGPTEFIPLAEETGFIDQIGEWALRTACTQNVVWQEAGLPKIRVAVNLSGHQLRKTALPDKVFDILTEVGLDCEWIELELTESALMDEGASQGRVQTETLRELSDQGVKLSIDDFGIGHSSLSHLRRLPFSTLKIDKSFIAGLFTEPKSPAVARGLIQMAHSLGLAVVAEGVESLKQLAFVRKEGCDFVQGYLVSRPVVAEGLGQLLASDFHLFSHLNLSDDELALPGTDSARDEAPERVARKGLVLQ